MYSSQLQLSGRSFPQLYAIIGLSREILLVFQSVANKLAYLISLFINFRIGNIETILHEIEGSFRNCSLKQTSIIKSIDISQWFFPCAEFDFLSFFTPMRPSLLGASLLCFPSITAV